MDGVRPVMPAVFVGHGNPMNALQDNAYTRGWRAIGKALPRPTAVLAVSAHWYLPGTRVTAMPAPRTIHDFGGFPRELYELTYPAPGDPALAGRLHDLLAPMPVTLKTNLWKKHLLSQETKQIYFRFAYITPKVILDKACLRRSNSSLAQLGQLNSCVLPLIS